MLAKDPAQRFQTPLEAARALAPFCQAGQRRDASSVGTTGVDGTSRVLGATVAAEEGSPFSILTADTVQVTNKERPGRPAGAARRQRPAVLAGIGAAFLAVVLAAVLLAMRKTPDGETTGKPMPAAMKTEPATKPKRPELLDCSRPGGISAEEVQRAQAAWAKYLERQVEETIDLGGGVTMTFGLIPPGKFLMGSPQDEKDRTEDETLYEVTLTEPFDLGKTEVTQAQYQALGLANLSRFKGDNLPVEMVSWTEARDWAEKLTKKRGDKHLYRLPTEAEWEYSCRGGRFSSQPFGVGDGRALSSQKANFDGNIPYGGADKGPNLQTTCAVASYPANAFGLHDMHGNVWEWCQDCNGPYPGGSVTNPTGPEEKEDSDRVYRGGGWDCSARHCRAASRVRSAPSDRGPPLGFRLARSVLSGVK
jgi:formylglycine-generating enzyme required for sulfatase activity